MPRILVAMALLCAAADAFMAPAPAALPAHILRAPRRALVLATAPAAPPCACPCRACTAKLETLCVRGDYRRGAGCGRPPLRACGEHRASTEACVWFDAVAQGKRQRRRLNHEAESLNPTPETRNLNPKPEIRNPIETLELRP